MNNNIKRLGLNLNAVAAELAHENADTQAAFFDSFMTELFHCCITDYNAQLQLHDIRDKCGHKTVDGLETLAYVDRTNPHGVNA